MPEGRPMRPFKQRIIDGFDRSRIRNEVQRARNRRFGWLKKKYATIALGASLAVGGIGLPSKAVIERSDPPKDATATARQIDSAGLRPPADEQQIRDQIGSDLKTAGEIASEVTGGVNAVARQITAPLVGPLPASEPVTETTEAPAALVADQVKESFFKTEVPFGQIIYSEAKKNDIMPELLAAVVQQESKFVPTARSPRGAIGLMQLMPKTGSWMGASDLTNPAENVRAGAKYLKYLSNRFEGDQKKMIAAYNAGEGNVRRFNGIPPFRETQIYVRGVLGFAQDLSERASSSHAQAALGVAGTAVANVLK
jgi:Transglycosylase SLT domain